MNIKRFFTPKSRCSLRYEPFYGEGSGYLAYVNRGDILEKLDFDITTVLWCDKNRWARKIVRRKCDHPECGEVYIKQVWMRIRVIKRNPEHPNVEDGTIAWVDPCLVEEVMEYDPQE